jgi:hypothetical protein
MDEHTAGFSVFSRAGRLEGLYAGQKFGKEGKVRTREVPIAYLLFCEIFYEIEGGAQEGFKEAGRLTGGGWGALDKAERGSREGVTSTATFVESDI